MSEPADSGLRGPFLPLLLVGIAFLGWSGFQSWELLRERSALETLRITQIQPLEKSQKLRAELDAIASNTQRLADSGDASAKLIVDELRKRGITINPDASTAQSPR